MKLIDLTGNMYGKLTVICRDDIKSVKRTYWKCKCECGNITSVDAYKLKNGITKSCGCWKSDLEKISHTTHRENGD